MLFESDGSHGKTIGLRDTRNTLPCSQVGQRAKLNRGKPNCVRAEVFLGSGAQRILVNQGCAVVSLMESNSTSKMSVVLGPITFPAPRSP